MERNCPRPESLNETEESSENPDSESEYEDQIRSEDYQNEALERIWMKKMKKKTKLRKQHQVKPDEKQNKIKNERICFELKKKFK